jgi:hypothetical protein
VGCAAARSTRNRSGCRKYLAEADAVDDGRVVELVAEHRVLVGQQRLKQAGVGVEAGGVEDRILGAVEGSDALLQRLVEVLPGRVGAGVVCVAGGG